MKLAIVFVVLAIWNFDTCHSFGFIQPAAQQYTDTVQNSADAAGVMQNAMIGSADPTTATTQDTAPAPAVSAPAVAAPAAQTTEEGSSTNDGAVADSGSTD